MARLPQSYPFSFLTAFLIGLLGFAACSLPKTQLVDSGHAILQVKPHSAPLFHTVMQNGIEFKQSRSPQGQFGGTFYEASIGRNPKTFNPIVSTDATSSQIAGLMFVGLADTDAYTGETVPHLAKTIEIKPDNRTYLVTLRKGLQWSDGQPLTADDVVYTWNELIKKGLGNASFRDVISVNNQLPEVIKVDDLTIRFVTPRPFAPFKGNLSTPILPKHIVEPIIRNNPKAFDSLWGVTAPPKSFVVNGPFILDDYLSGQRVTLKRNPLYFMVDPAGHRLPYLDRYVITFVQDFNAELLQFEQGYIDSLPVPGSEVFYVKHLSSPDFRLYDLGPSSGTLFLMFNLNNRRNKETGQPYVDPIKARWFQNLQFRQAVDWAIRRDQIVQNILMGVGAPLYTAESLSSVYLNKTLAKGHPADVAKARAFLQAGGFHWNPAGQLLDDQNHPVVFELTTNTGNLERESVGVNLKEDLEQLGMKVNFKPIDFNVLVGKMDSSDWEAMIIGLTGSPIEPHSGKNVWQSTGSMHIFNQRNPKTDLPGSDHPYPWETQLDQLFDAGASTLDPVERHHIYDHYQQVVYDALPFIYLYSPKSIVAIRTRIQNVDPTPLGIFHNIESIWVKNKSQ